MSHGLPDWYRGVDIAYQALAEMITRPKYGAAHAVSGIVAAVANDEVTLVTVSGKGMIYGGNILFTHTASQKNSMPRLYVDGQLMASLTYLELSTYYIKNEHAYPVYELVYNDAAHIYSVGVARGITFETSFSLAYYEAHGDTPNITYYGTYALI